MKVDKNYLLKKLNAFHVPIRTNLFAEIKSPDDASKLFANPKYKRLDKYIIGEGSNTFFTKDYEGLVIKPGFYGIEKLRETAGSIIIQAGASTIWDRLVAYAVDNDYSGIENLSAIPGTVGAAPVHNIAAYGQNFEDVFHSLSAVRIKDGKNITLTKNDCKFGYRTSIFKEKYKNKFLITSVRLKLKKEKRLETKYSSRYESLEDELKKFSNPPYTIGNIRKAVINIRTRKFPDWKKYGNTGSYFLNPVITVSKLKEIQRKYPGVQYYPLEKLTYVKGGKPNTEKQSHVKIAAGWLLEELGWKGKRIGNVGTSPNQALVIINYGNATAEEILSFAKKMQDDFYKNFKVNLVPEVTII